MEVVRDKDGERTVQRGERRSHLQSCVLDPEFRNLESDPLSHHHPHHRCLFPWPGRSFVNPVAPASYDMDHDVGVCSEKASSIARIPALPAEILARIIGFLETPVDPNASTLPHPAGSYDIDSAPPLPQSTNTDVLSAALSSRLLHRLSERALYRCPLIRTLKSFNLLAATIVGDAKQSSSQISAPADDAISRVAWIRSIHLPPGDGLLQPGDTLADQTSYVDSLRTFFDNASRIDFLCLEHRQAGAALLQFLHPSTACRPRRLTLSNLSFSAPPFSTVRSLEPLQNLSHLHLIKIVPPPALISFLIGEPINTEDQGRVVSESIEASLSPRGTLECLRLSLLPPDTLIEFEAYIAWRKAWKEYEQLTSQEQAHLEAPRAPRGPARRFAVQEALYDLATHSSSLPRLRLLLLELSPLGQLPSPNPLCANARLEDRAQLSDKVHFDLAKNPSRAAALRESLEATGVTATHFVSGFLSSTGSGDFEEMLERGASDDLRVSERDKYWRQVEAGKIALINLWSEQELTDGARRADIRVVAAKPNGHDRNEGFLDFYCQAQHESGSSLDAREIGSTTRTIEGCEGASEVGSWADPDVFSLIETGPWLAFRKLGGLSSENQGKDVPSWYWTGDLPRERTQPRPLFLPSRVLSTFRSGDTP